MAAAEAYLAAGLEERADELLSRVKPSARADRFRLALLESRTAWAVGEDDRSLRAAERADRIARGDVVSGLNMQDARLSVQLAFTRHALLASGDLARALEMSRSAVRTATTMGSGQLARAQYLLGTALSLSGDPAYREPLEAAVRLARQVGDTDLELRAGNNLVASHELAGNHPAGRRLARDLVARARELGQDAHVAQYQAALANLDALDGWVQRSLRACDQTLAGIVEPRTRDQLEVTRCLVLLDLNRIEDARTQITASTGTAAGDSQGRAQFAYLEAEAELMVGRPLRCLMRLDDLIHTLPLDGELSGFARLTRLRAQAEIEHGAPDEREEWPAIPFFRAAPVEAEAFALRAAGRHADAARRFTAAARLWRPHYLRSSLSCTRQGALELLSDGHDAGAVTRLEAAERLAERRGMAWELAQIRKALRATGQRRSTPVTPTPTGLTAGEAQVLGMAAAGATNQEIAARLGVTRRTVETQLAAANAKLGTGSRGAAAARVAPR
jgi:DNA-binding CsgD family transcriptional regulator